MCLSNHDYLTDKSVILKQLRCILESGDQKFLSQYKYLPVTPLKKICIIQPLHEQNRYCYLQVVPVRVSIIDLQPYRNLCFFVCLGLSPTVAAWLPTRILYQLKVQLRKGFELYIVFVQENSDVHQIFLKAHLLWTTVFT